MKKTSTCILIAILAVTSIFAELPKVGNDAESVIYAFQTLADSLYKAGSPSLADVDWHNPELELKTYSEQLKLDYETVRQYVASIEQGMKKVEASGMLSKTEFADFKNTMENCFSIQMLSLEHCKFPENMQAVYDNPNIAILENNAKVHAANIEQAQKLLDEMQTPAQIQETLKKEHDELEQLKNAKKKESKRIAELENHSVELGLAYGQALSNEQRYKKIIADNTSKLNAIPGQIQKYKEYADSEYKKAFMQQISDIRTWIDFFNGKNSAIHDFFTMLDTKSAMQKKLDNIVPQKDSKAYQARLDNFLKSWKL